MIGKSGIVADRLLREVLIRKLVSDNILIVDNQRERAIGPLLSICMKQFRGKISGEECSKVIASEINRYLDKDLWK